MPPKPSDRGDAMEARMVIVEVMVPWVGDLEKSVDDIWAVLMGMQQSLAEVQKMMKMQQSQMEMQKTMMERLQQTQEGLQ